MVRRTFITLTMILALVFGVGAVNVDPAQAHHNNSTQVRNSTYSASYIQFRVDSTGNTFNLSAGQQRCCYPNFGLAFYIGPNRDACITSREVAEPSGGCFWITGTGWWEVPSFAKTNHITIRMVQD